MGYSSIRTHPFWKRWLLDKMVIEYATDSRNSRIRIEVGTLTPIQRAKALSVIVDCTACGIPMHPIRERRDGTLYYASSCKLEDNVACARGINARTDYDDMRAVLEAR